MAKSNQIFTCTSCGHESPKWLGICPGCKEWNSFIEQEKITDKKKPHKAKIPGLELEQISTPQTLDDISAEETSRFQTGIAEFDRVLGGGCMRGSYVLIGGAPGVGKSTLTLQIAKSEPNLSISSSKKSGFFLPAFFMPWIIFPGIEPM